MNFATFLETRLTPFRSRSHQRTMGRICTSSAYLSNEYVPTMRIPTGGIHCFSHGIDPMMAVGTLDEFHTLKLIRPHRKLNNSELRKREFIEDVEDPQFDLGDKYTLFELSKFHRKYFTDLHFSDDNHLLFTASEDCTVRMFDCSQLKVVRGSFLGTSCISFKSRYWKDQRSLVSSTNHGLVLWDTRTINKNSILTQHSDTNIPFINDFCVQDNMIYLATKEDGLEFRDLRKFSSGPIFSIVDDFLVSEVEEFENVHRNEIFSLSVMKNNKELLFNTSHGSVYYVPSIHLLPSTKRLTTSNSIAFRIFHEAPTIRKSVRGKKMEIPNQFLSFCGLNNEYVLLNDQRNRILVLSKRSGDVVKEFTEISRSEINRRQAALGYGGVKKVGWEQAPLLSLSTACCGDGDLTLNSPDVIGVGTHEDVIIYTNSRFLRSQENKTQGVASSNRINNNLNLSISVNSINSNLQQQQPNNETIASSSGIINNSNRSSSSSPLIDVEFGGNFGSDYFQPSWSEPLQHQDKYSCTFRNGYMPWQQVSICLTCMGSQQRNRGRIRIDVRHTSTSSSSSTSSIPDQNETTNSVVNNNNNGREEQELFGFCRECEQFCHRALGHVTARIGKKSLFQCDCGVRGICYCELKKTMELQKNSENKYNDNFKNLFCYCKSLNASNSNNGFVDEEAFMYQCVRCEDWFHENCIFRNTENREMPMNEIVSLIVLERIRDGQSIHFVCENCFSVDEIAGNSFEIVFQAVRGMYYSGEFEQVRRVGGGKNSMNDEFEKMCREISTTPETPVSVGSGGSNVDVIMNEQVGGGKETEGEVIIRFSEGTDGNGEGNEDDLLIDSEEEEEGEEIEDLDDDGILDGWIV